MNNRFTKINAFSVAELFLVLAIIGVLVFLTLKVQKSQTNYANKFMGYSAFTNLKKGVEELVVQGYESGGTIIRKLPTANPTGTTGFCQRLAQLYNTVGLINCATNVTSGFTGSNANFITTNGIRFYNFGAAPSGGIYTVYLDIDGPKRNSELNKDIIQFKVYIDGDVLPSVDSIAATDSSYLSASVRYWDKVTAKYFFPVSGVSYKEALCKAGRAQSIDAGYCGSYTPLPTCMNVNYICEVILNKPKFMLN